MKPHLLFLTVALLVGGGPGALAQNGGGAGIQEIAPSQEMNQRFQGMMQQILDRQELIMQSTMPKSQAQSGEHEHYPVADQEHTNIAIPKPLQAEHEELHAELARLIKSGRRTGEAAQKLAGVLDPHFQKENEYALPPLGLLVPLSEGKFDCNMTVILKLTDKLRAEMPTMLSEHKDIGTALAQLRNAAMSENYADGVRFAEHLAAHAQMEEHVTYPTALLIGLYVKNKSDQCAK